MGTKRGAKAAQDHLILAHDGQVRILLYPDWHDPNLQVAERTDVGALHVWKGSCSETCFPV